MAPPKRPWFRFYVEALWDRKLRKLAPSHRWLWVTVLGCARSSPRPGLLLLVEGGEAMDLEDLADAAALKVADTRRGMAALEKLAVVDRDEETGAWRVVKWNERQYESDRRPKAPGKRRPNDVDTSPNGSPNDAASSDDGAPPENRRQKTESDNPPTPAEAGERVNPREKGTNPRAVAERRRKAATAERQAVIDACDRCDKNGKRWVEDEEGFSVAEICEHSERVSA